MQAKTHGDKWLSANLGGKPGAGSGGNLGREAGGGKMGRPRRAAPTGVYIFAQKIVECDGGKQWTLRPVEIKTYGVDPWSRTCGG